MIENFINLSSKDYAFLDENEHIGNNICLLTLYPMV